MQPALQIELSMSDKLCSCGKESKRISLLYNSSPAMFVDEERQSERVNFSKILKNLLDIVVRNFSDLKL